MRALLQAAAVLGLLLADWLMGTSRDRIPSREAPIVRFVVKHPRMVAAGLTAVAITGALLGIASGVVPIKASSGHWPITASLLDFAKVRSVSTHSLGIQAPSLDDPTLVIRGASHYASGCDPCHGGPGGGVPPVMAAMTPPPPELTDLIARWTPEELFSIVKHGIKFTGMPAWPAQQRDDEVWAVVAFLRTMPRLDAAGYRRLAYGDPSTTPNAAFNLSPDAGQQPPPAVRDVCWRCHGVNGTGRGPGAFPSLAGQRAAYLYASLRAFAGRSRFSGIMNAIASTLSDQAMREAAEHYERQPSRSAALPADASAVARGAAIASRGIPDRNVPSCADCHGPSDNPKNPAYPIIGGQHAGYLASQLELLKQRQRGGSPYVNLMHAFVDQLGPEMVRDVTLYYATLPKQ